MALLTGSAAFLARAVVAELPQRGDMLCIARLDCAVDLPLFLKLLQAQDIAYDRDMAEVLKRVPGFTSKELFYLLNFRSYTDVDFDVSTRCDIVHDLNRDLPAEQFDRYDFVFENGTLEHIFDIKTAVGNVARAVKTGGHVCHISPLTAINHGFYNFSINFFADFYRANGFTDMQFHILRTPRNYFERQDVYPYRVPYTHKQILFNPEIFTSEHPNLGVGFVARKVRHFDEVQIPIQAFYDPALKLEQSPPWVEMCLE